MAQFSVKCLCVYVNTDSMSRNDSHKFELRTLPKFLVVVFLS